VREAANPEDLEASEHWKRSSGSADHCPEEEQEAQGIVRSLDRQ
jgi:hypothetical protein